MNHSRAYLGGTVFPLADIPPVELFKWSRRTDPGKYKQNIECKEGVAAKPQKGKAILWYNHFVRAPTEGSRRSLMWVD